MIPGSYCYKYLLRMRAKGLGHSNKSNGRAPPARDQEIVMAVVHVVDRKGVSQTVEADNGLPLMYALRYLSDGVDAICGGACSCSTCHVYIDPQWLDRLPTKDSQETLVLEGATEPKGNSRLSCQIEVTDDLDGLTMTIAPA